MAAVFLPNWLIDENAITLATWGLVFATLLLVFITVFLYLDSYLKGKEQKRRWKEEDEQRDRDRKEERARWQRDDAIRLDSQQPKLTFGLDLRTIDERNVGPVNIWCSNLGIVAFHVESVVVRRMTSLEDDQHDIQFAAQQLVTVGEMVRLPIPESVFRGLLLSVDLEFKLVIATANSQLVTDPNAYSILCGDQGRVSTVRPGFYEDRIVICSSCGSNGYFSPNGLRSRAELLAKMSLAKREMVETCPQHSSTVLRSILNSHGIRTWSSDTSVSVNNA